MNPEPQPVFSLKSPQTVIALYLITIFWSILAGIFWKGDTQLITAVSTGAIGMILGSITGFYYGSSTGSQAKEGSASKLPPLPPMPPAP